MEQKKINYENGKIYKIVCNKTGLVYIGSTTKKYLSQRLQSHLKSYRRFKAGKQTKTTTSFQIFDNKDFDIVLIEKYPCEDKLELHKRERYYIESIKCVNKAIPTRTYKEYYDDNKDQLNKKSLEKYYANHEENKQKSLISYHKNKEKYSEQAKLKKYECECGSTCRYAEKSKHLKTKKHIDFINMSVSL